ncbi:MAG: SDR family oxidoreductase [Bacteriodetes bacterium]|nr:SDR family oxidoreductase [Bacteroidota bacterium]
MQSTTPTILITGASGKVSSAIIRYFNQETDYRLLLVASREFPLLKGNSEERNIQCVIPHGEFNTIREVAQKYNPEFIINTVAMTDVDGCEINRQLAQELNVKSVENYARLARICSSHLIQLSTDYIFDGAKGPYTETDTPNPICYYGKTKLAGENICKSATIPYTILRTNVVYGIAPGMKPDFIQWVLKMCDVKEPFKVVDDQFSNPTIIDDIALAIGRIITKKRTGIYNIGGADYINRLEMAKTIARHFKKDADLIYPMKTSDLKQVAKRPLRGGLITLKASTDLSFAPTSLESGLQIIQKQMKDLM